MSDESVTLIPQPYTPLADEGGRPRSRLGPYLPVIGACELCPARCCRLHVKASLPDAIHYCSTLGIPFFAGLTLVGSEDPEHAFALNEDPRLPKGTKPWPGSAEIELRRREDGGCHALVDLGGHERCGVYGARPSFCRTYPATWRADTVQGGPAAIICPVPYGITPSHEAELRADIQRSIRYWRTHDQVVAAWNAEDLPRTIEAFLNYAIPRAAEALDLVVGPTLARGHRDERLYDAMLEAKVVAPAKYALPPREKMFADLPVKGGPPR